MSQDKLITNPAGRLRNILRSIEEVEERTGLQVWAKVFGITDVNSAAGLVNVNLQLIALRNLFDETLLALQELPNLNEKLFITPTENLSRVISWEVHSKSYLTYLANSFDNYRKLLNEVDLNALNYAEDALAQSGKFNERVIAESEIEAIIIELNTLYASINSSTLPIELKDSLLELIIEMRQSISEYKIRGAKALYRALTKSVGVIAVNKETIEENKENPSIQELINLIHKIEEANDTATNNKWTLLLNAASGILPPIV